MSNIINTKYYSKYIKVNLVESVFGSKIDLHYNPPPSLWRFYSQRTLDELEQELANILYNYINLQNNKSVKQQMICQVENVLNNWINQGWLTIETLTREE